MIPEDIYKKLLRIFGTDRIGKESELELEKLKTYREAINNFDSYNKFDALWILDGIWGTEQECLDMAKEYHALYEELNNKRRDKWGDDCEP